MSTRVRFLLASVAVGALLLVTGCTWAFPRFDIGGTGHNTAESTLTLGNVDGLHEVWKTPPLGLFRSDPVASGSTVFVVGQQTLYAFDLAGSVGCAGTPKVCQPLWTASLSRFGQASVVGTTVFVAGAAFDATGSTGCSGTPKTCQPLFATQQPFSRTVAADGLLFATPALTGAKVLDVYDVAGTTGCSGSPKVCAPLRSYWATCAAGETCTAGQPVIASDRVVVGLGASSAIGYGGRIGSFDRTGDLACDGVPVICAPLWSAEVGWPGNLSITGGAVHATTFSYVNATSVDTEGVVSLDAATGAARWTATAGAADSFADHAVAGGAVYVAGANRVHVFPTSCTTPCARIRSAPVAGFATGPLVANGVVYSGTSVALQAFAADGTGCTGSPSTCAPVATIPLAAPGRPVAVQAGKVLVMGDDQVVRVLGLT